MGKLNNGSNTNKPESMPQQEAEEAEASKLDDNQESFPNSLKKQNSIFSLTLDEIQCKSGRSFGSMNMEEFIANIWSVEEENQAISPETNQEEMVIPNMNNSCSSNSINLNLSRQGSFSIPIPLCKKTVEEIWFEIHKEELLLSPDDHDHDLQGAGEAAGQKTGNDSGPERQQTLGEMTLEDFLVKAGVVQESFLQVVPASGAGFAAAGSALLSYSHRDKTTMVAAERQRKHNKKTAQYCSGSDLDVNKYTRENENENENESDNTGGGFGGYQMYGQVEVCKDSSTKGCEKGQGHGHGLRETSGGGAKSGSTKKRIIDGPPEVVVERRQRRMIKNRESAARSRARKQAYTVALEDELNQLKEENEKLKQIMAETELKRKREVLMKRKQSSKAQKLAEKLRTIRRAMSLAW